MDAGIGRAALVAAALVLGLVVAGADAQDTGPPPPAAPPPPAETVIPPPDAGAAPPTPPEGPANAAVSDSADNDAVAEAPVNRTVVPELPPVPLHGQAAVLRVLDKVTAETMAFEAPIGQRIRYKGLVFDVKTCVIRGPRDPQPQPAAYLTITSDGGAATAGPLEARQVFRGWMFADAPALHALTHPVYDAWLISCSATAPAT